MWPSLDVATWLSGVANIVLIVSLAAVAGSTALVVWLSNVKEGYWDKERVTLVAETTRLSAAAETAKAEIATAQSAAATATERAAAANERAATLEKDAAQARLEQERLKSIVNWRVLDPVKVAKLASALSRSRGTVTLRYVATDPEAIAMAVQISRAFEEANRLAGQQVWTVGPDPHLYPNRLVFLIHIPDLNTDDSRAVRAAFTEAGIEFQSDDVNEGPGGAMIGGLTLGEPSGRPNALIIVGSKSPPF